MSSETGPLDDAALVRPEGALQQLVLTLDVITPVVDDPRVFGRIAAANALSDVYAMGGEPQVALSYAGVPEALGLDVLEAILQGAAETCLAARCAIIGGHTLRDPEPKCGLAVVGSVEAGRAWSHARGQPQQALVLTKALGTGVLTQALRAGHIQEPAMSAAVHQMQTLNDLAARAGRRHGVTAATDITGFGLLGHLHQLAHASGLSARVEIARVPLLEGAIEAARAGHLPGGSRRNAAYVAPFVHVETAAEPALLALLSDAQTSGGLLLALPPTEALALVDELGAAAACIGQLVEGLPGHLRLV